MDLTQLFADFITATSFYAMVVTGGADILAAIYQSVREGNFQVKLLPLWLQTKVMHGILPVLAMFAASLAVADPFSTVLGGAASAGAAAFIAANTYSIFKHLGVQPPEARQAYPDDIAPPASGFTDPD